jgi:hypothetical protein
VVAISCWLPLVAGVGDTDGDRAVGLEDHGGASDVAKAMVLNRSPLRLRSNELAELAKGYPSLLPLMNLVQCLSAVLPRCICSEKLRIAIRCGLI